MKLPNRRMFHLGMLCAAAAAMSPVRSQGYPSRPISWIVPWSAGGSADFATRLIGSELARALGQSVAVENVGGGGGLVGLTKASQAPADGHVIYYGGTEMFVPAMTNPSISTDWARQFKPVALLITNPFILVTRAGAPYGNLTEFNEFAERNRGNVTYGSPGIATGQHLAGEMMRDKAKIALVHIPYRGGAQIVPDLLAGTIECAFLIGATAQPHLKTGALKAIAIADATRHPVFPNIPTFNEHPTYRGLIVSPFGAVMVPAATPDAVVQKLSDAFEIVMRNDMVRQRLAESGARVQFLAHRELRPFIAAEVARYKQVIEFANVKVSS